jgi:hypothetical protein
MTTMTVNATRRATARWLVLGLLTAGLVVTGPASAQAAAAPAQAAAATALTSAQLHIVSIRCYGQNDTWGSDEPYFLVNGVRVWERGNVNYLQTVSVDVYVPFEDVVTLEMWEDDGGLTGRDDLMARWFMFTGEAGSGVHGVWTQYGGGSYIMYYEVV